MEAADEEDDQEDHLEDVAAAEADPAQVDFTNTGGETDASASSRKTRTE